MRRLAVLALLLGWAVCAYAGAAPVEFEFISWYNGQWQNGYPYVIQPLGGSGDNILFVMCNDYVHAGMPGDIWDANITQLGSGNISLTRFNKMPSGPNSLAPLLRYDEAGWILLQTLDTPMSMFQAMNYAVWNLFDPSAPCDSGCQLWLMNAEQAAQMHFPDTDFNKVYVITPVNQYDPDPNGPQEFLAIGTDSGLIIHPPGAPETPEPGTLVLLGTGVAAMVGRKFLS
jgi:PEP-CTERM motif